MYILAVKEHLKGSPFPENIYNDKKTPKKIMKTQFLSRKEFYGYFYCYKSIILICQYGCEKTIRDLMFSPENLKNGIRHENLGKLIIKSALICYYGKKPGEFASICRGDDDKWYLAKQGESTELDLSVWLEDMKALPIFLFFEIQN